MILRPKTIAPGWAKRWTQQSIDLFRRAPGLAVGIMTLFGTSNAFIPQPIALDVPLTVFMVGLLFSSLRAADHDSGHALSATWTFFRQSARDLAHLNMRLSYMVFMSGLLACSFLMPILKHIPSFWIGCAMMTGFAAAFWWFGTWGYLWCREMFEGTRENARETAKQHAHVSAAA